MIMDTVNSLLYHLKKQTCMSFHRQSTRVPNLILLLAFKCLHYINSVKKQNKATIIYIALNYHYSIKICGNCCPVLKKTNNKKYIILLTKRAEV